MVESLAIEEESGESRSEADQAGPVHSERHRLDVLHSYGILDTPPEAAFDRITDLASVLFEVSAAFVTFIDADRQWIKAGAAGGPAQTPRHLAFCDHTIRDDSVLVVPDARLDPRFAGNPLVIGQPHIRFYAGAPVTTPDGVRLGAVCVVSDEPRTGFGARDRERLQVLAGIAANELELRREAARAQRLAEQNRFLVTEMAHRVRSSLRLVAGVLEAQAASSDSAAVRQALHEATDRVTGLELVHQQLWQGERIFSTDSRAYLMALLGGLQEAGAHEEAGRLVSLRLPETLSVAPARLAALGMVVTELVTNALKHGHGAVAVEVSREDDVVVVTVEDEGAGFAQPRRPLVSPERLGLRLVSMVAIPGGITVDPDCPQRISVRVAA